MKVICLAVAIGAFSLGLSSCGDSSPAEPDPIPVQNSLVFTRADNSTIVFAGNSTLAVWCGPWEDGVVAAPSVQVRLLGPTAGDPHWLLQGVVADVTIGQSLAFPNDFIWNEPKDVNMFISDPSNELSTQDDRSSGSITFQKLQCGTGGELQFTIDAVIGSEFGDGPSVGVKGSFRAPIGQ